MRKRDWLGKSPKALPVLVTYVNRKKPDSGMDCPGYIVSNTKALDNWSANRAATITNRDKPPRKSLVRFSVKCGSSMSECGGVDRGNALLAGSGLRLVCGRNDKLTQLVGQSAWAPLV